MSEVKRRTLPLAESCETSSIDGGGHMHDWLRAAIEIWSVRVRHRQVVGQSVGTVSTQRLMPVDWTHESDSSSLMERGLDAATPQSMGDNREQPDDFGL